MHDWQVGQRLHRARSPSHWRRHVATEERKAAICCGLVCTLAAKHVARTSASMTSVQCVKKLSWSKLFCMAPNDCTVCSMLTWYQSSWSAPLAGEAMRGFAANERQTWELCVQTYINGLHNLLLLATCWRRLDVSSCFKSASLWWFSCFLRIPDGFCRHFSTKTIVDDLLMFFVSGGIRLSALKPCRRRLNWYQRHVDFRQVTLRANAHVIGCLSICTCAQTSIWIRCMITTKLCPLLSAILKLWWRHVRPPALMCFLYRVYKGFKSILFGEKCGRPSCSILKRHIL